MYGSNKRLALSIFWIALGAVLVGLSVAEILKESIFSAMGGALMCVGALQAARILRYRKDADYRERFDIEVRDERNAFLRMKTWSLTGCIVIVIEGIGAIAAMLLGQRTIQLFLSYSVSLIVVVYWIVYLILRKKY